MQHKHSNKLRTKLLKHHALKSINRHFLIKTLRYTFKFASIISPGSLKDMTLASNVYTKSDDQTNPKRSNNVHIKQSYVLLTWITYIREAQLLDTTKSTKNSGDTEESTTRTPSFFIHPPHQSKLTFLKAPMAHKTFSQEQFLNKSYTLTISFNNMFREHSTLHSINNSLYTALYLRSTMTPVETNLLFLKKLRMSITCQDQNYFQLN